MKDLEEYIASNVTATRRAATAGPDPGARAEPSLSKLLFPKALTKANTPDEFRLWLTGFQ